MRDRLTEALKRSRADYAEVRFERSWASRVSFRGKRLEVAAESADAGGCVRVLVQGPRLGRRVVHHPGRSAEDGRRGRGDVAGGRPGRAGPPGRGPAARGRGRPGDRRRPARDPAGREAPVPRAAERAAARRVRDDRRHPVRLLRLAHRVVLREQRGDLAARGAAGDRRLRARHGPRRRHDRALSRLGRVPEGLAERAGAGADVHRRRRAGPWSCWRRRRSRAGPTRSSSIRAWRACSCTRRSATCPRRTSSTRTRRRGR